MATYFRSASPYSPPSRCPTPPFIPNTEDPEGSLSWRIQTHYDPMVQIQEMQERYSRDFENKSRAPTPGYSPVGIPHDWPSYGTRDEYTGYLTPKSRSPSPCSSSRRATAEWVSSIESDMMDDARIDVDPINVAVRVSEYLERYVQDMNQEVEMPVEGLDRHFSDESLKARIEVYTKPRRKSRSVRQRKVGSLQMSPRVTRSVARRSREACWE
ncbi:hypothetical protein BT96DRAFT_921846 [Gymnopus androsaceus JB14]|uniref:Uncharacterized protein n=1 Tax=Gymnopus androsaceus JB14 TaxID=1447944 RepID=A0A6A4HIK0_9AGAR|nr:hypothetical protein BT96DRAFT_921846 [Gymnopus androsaceus JB14]